jgi:hypothetical protein
MISGRPSVPIRSAADVQWFAGGAEDGGDDVAVAQQAGQGRADGDAGGVEDGGAEAAGERVVIHGHGDGGRQPAWTGPVPAARYWSSTVVRAWARRVPADH